MGFVNRRFTADFHEQAAQAREMEAYVCCRRQSVRVIVQNDDTRLEREALGMASTLAPGVLQAHGLLVHTMAHLFRNQFHDSSTSSRGL